MKWNKLGRGTLASILSLALVSVTACSRDYVLAYVYVTTAKPLTTASKNGGVSAYAVDYQIGSLTPLADSPIEAGTESGNAGGFSERVESVCRQSRRLDRRRVSPSELMGRSICRTPTT